MIVHHLNKQRKSIFAGNLLIAVLLCSKAVLEALEITFVAKFSGVDLDLLQLAVNFMVGMAIDLIPVVGIVFAIVIFIVGHLFNLVMNGLGGFIHTLRLHFLEHFSKYYDGGGKEYTPYFANRNKTLVDKK